jgi:radical SAM superfamily enzyme YgiQ (UPF0313 family)
MTWKRPLLIYPYSPDKKSERLYGGLAIINPIGLEVVATRLKPVVEDLLLVDMRVETEPLETLIRRFRPDMIAVSLMWGRDEFTDALLRSLPRDVTIVLGGLYATREADQIVRDFPEMDILAVGYGEDALRELVERGSPEGVAGLWYRKRPTAWPPDTRATLSETKPALSEAKGASASSAELVKNPRRVGVHPEHYHLDRSIRRYEYPWMTLKGDNIITSVGCPMVCAFCKWRENIFGDLQPWIGREPEDVVAELAATDADVVHLVDANFAADLARLERICDLLIERDVRHLYACEIRINALAKSAELVKKMERAGFFMFMVGVESYQPRLLKAMRKGYTVEMCRRAFRHLADTSILTLGNFLIGNPGETAEDMLGIADYAAELGIDFISPNKIYAYADTDFEQWVLAQPGMKVVGRRRYVVSDHYGVEDLRRIQARIQLRFLRKHPPWIAYRKALAHPMVEKLGRERIRRAMLRSLWNHLADAGFRRRAIRRFLKRFQRPKAGAAAL